MEVTDMVGEDMVAEVDMEDEEGTENTQIIRINRISCYINIYRTSSNLSIIVGFPRKLLYHLL